MRKRSVRAAGVAAGLLVTALAGCASTAHENTSAGAPTGGGGVRLSVRDIHGVGPVLVDNAGLTLYVYAPDKRHSVTCALTCQGIWPPITVSSLSAVHAGAGVQTKLLGSDPDDVGGAPVLTYDGWPLYTYIQDNPGEASGEGIDSEGGVWFAMGPTGSPVTTKS